MPLKLFTDIIDALGKAARGIKAVADFPKEERAAIRAAFEDTYRLIDTSLNMVIFRLGDILRLDDAELIREASGLDNWGPWYEAERAFSLCGNLRAAVREAETLRGTIGGKISTKDWDAVLDQMHRILSTEAELGHYVSEHFVELAGEARAAGSGSAAADELRARIRDVRTELSAQRRKLLKQEMELSSQI